ncbi:MAG: hypothetical protein AB1480_16540 [Nitrospirota bacterium]
MKGLKVLCLFITLFLAGCAHTWSPGSVPEIGLDTVSQYQEKFSVDLINDEPNTTPQLFAGIGGHTHYANYNEWTQFFINDYAKELTKRGVNVSKDSPNKLKVKVGKFAFFQGFAKVRVNMTVVLTSDDGKWSKTFEETDTSGWNMGRAFGSVIYHTIEKLLKDPEVMNRMKVTTS